MAPGGGNRRKKKDRGKPKNVGKFKKLKTKPKNKSYRDIKHSHQYQQYKLKEEQTRKHVPKKVEESSSEEENTESTLEKLLSTFGSKNGVNTLGNIAVESDDSSDEMDLSDNEGDEEIDFDESLKSSDLESESSLKGDEDVNDGEPEMSESEDGSQINIDNKKDLEENDNIGEVEEVDKFEDQLDNEDENETNNLLDPFQIHFGYDLSIDLLDSLSAAPPKVKVTKSYWPILHNLKIEIPICENKSVDSKGHPIILGEQTEFAKEYNPPKVITDIDWNTLCVKSQIQNNILKANKKHWSEATIKEPLSNFQKELFSVLNNYQDLYYPEESLQNQEEIKFVYCLHAVNHILKTRIKIIHHNAKLLKKSKSVMPDEFRDQGLARPKVVILVPFRESCLRIVNIISDILLSDTKGKVMNKSRFVEEFSGAELFLPKKNPKPEDYESLFKGNIDDTFRIGLSITKKTLKLYADFYSSDIIIASPLGLRMVIGSEGDKERDYDFLSSIELLILDQTDVFLMQNWDHLLLIFDHLHVQPKESHGTDFSRIRSWALNGWTKYYRQTLIFSSITTPEINSLGNRRCENYAGKIRVLNPVDNGSICQVVIPLSQVFQKFKANSISDAIDARFKLFTEKILPHYKDSIMSGVLIYVPSYFDFIRIRNYLKREDYTFVQICEYSKDSKVARARDMFFHNDARILLYSERFHFFRRIRLKGIRHIIFYQLPTFPHFYSELCNLMQENNQNKFLGNDGSTTVTVLYSNYDVHQLAAVVRTSRAARMVKSDKDVHMFATEQS